MNACYSRSPCCAVMVITYFPQIERMAAAVLPCAPLATLPACLTRSPQCRRNESTPPGYAQFGARRRPELWKIGDALLKECPIAPTRIGATNANDGSHTKLAALAKELDHLQLEGQFTQDARQHIGNGCEFPGGSH
jgi:hypothetical protein